MGLGFRLRIFLIILVSIMAVGIAGFMATENLSLSDSVYFTVVTIATVGYGDISPVTTAGRMLSIFLIITGVGTFLGVVANATELLLNKQEQKARMQKLNMVVSVFFSEVGTQFLTYFTGGDPHVDSISGHLIVAGNWKKEEFALARGHMKRYGFSVDIRTIELESLRAFLNDKSTVILRLLENPSLLEHESFTDLIRALLHLKDELAYRGDFSKLPDSDLEHLAGDIKRAYSLLASHWLDYTEYLKEYYPYLFSLAVRTNPFNRERSVVVE